jgi:hypothetical protein
LFLSSFLVSSPSSERGCLASLLRSANFKVISKAVISNFCAQLFSAFTPATFQSTKELREATPAIAHNLGAEAVAIALLITDY